MTNIIIYTVPGSQFAFKVLCALESRNIPHYVHFVPMNPEERKKVLPSGSTFVPEMQVFDVTKKEEGIILSDSEAILHWFDKNTATTSDTPTNFFPVGTNAIELSERANTKILSGMVWYYNWVDPIGYERSLRKKFARVVPFWVPTTTLRSMVVDWYSKETRIKKRKEAAEAIGCKEDLLDHEPMIRSMLIAELIFFQSLLVSSDQLYLLPSPMKQITTSTASKASNNELESIFAPSAVDFSVYAQLQRLVGCTSTDFVVPSAIPEIRNNHPELNRLWEWYDFMHNNHSVHFKNKRIPAHIGKDLGIIA